MSIYLILRESDGVAINAIEYDGTDAYDPGDGLLVIPWDEVVRPWVGWQQDADGTWMAPIAPEEDA